MGRLPYSAASEARADPLAPHTVTLPPNGHRHQTLRIRKPRFAYQNLDLETKHTLVTRFACCFHKVGVKGIHFTKLKRNLDTKVKTPKTKVFKCNRSHCYMIVRIEKYYLAYLLVILSTLCAVQGCSRKRARPPMLIARQLDVREE